MLILVNCFCILKKYYLYFELVTKNSLFVIEISNVFFCVVNKNVIFFALVTNIRCS